MDVAMISHTISNILQWMNMNSLEPRSNGLTGIYINHLEIELFGGSSLQAKYQWLNKIAYQIGLKPKETFQSHTPS
jgi:hypothetical protein